MEVDPLNAVGIDDDAPPSRDARARQLNTWVAISVALLATFMGICKVKDDNLVQAMQQAQADKLDNWSFYQARNIRQEIAQAQVDQLEVVAAGQTGAALARTTPVIAKYRALVADQATKKEVARKQAEADQVTYDKLNYHDDQFDLSDALTAIAISLLALTSLTQRRWLFWVAIVATVFGVIMGVAGLFSLQLHSDTLAKLLS
ncbi:MAG: DUF4337 domain-containing protein [bacterium]